MMIEVIGLDKAIKNMEEYLARKYQESAKVVKASSANVKKISQQLVPKDLGDLKKNIRYKVVKRKYSITGEISANSHYAAYVEFGTGAPRKPPPLSAIEGWAERHGVNPYALQKKIMVYGTSTETPQKGPVGQKFMEPSFDREAPQFLNAIRRVYRAP